MLSFISSERTRHSQSHSQFDDSAGRRAFNNSGMATVVAVVRAGDSATNTAADTARQQFVSSAPATAQ